LVLKKWKIVEKSDYIEKKLPKKSSKRRENFFKFCVCVCVSCCVRARVLVRFARQNRNNISPG